MRPVQWGGGGGGGESHTVCPFCPNPRASPGKSRSEGGEGGGGSRTSSLAQEPVIIIVYSYIPVSG